MDVLLIFVPGGESSLACSGWVNVEHCGTINININKLTFDLERATQIYLIVVICRCLRPCQKREKERGGEKCLQSESGRYKSRAMESHQIRPFQIKPATWPSNWQGGFMKTHSTV